MIQAHEGGGTSIACGMMMRSLAAARVGCSGWQYKHWRGEFYPADLPASRWFEFYASVFDTVEINNTFYRLPEEKTFEAWAARAPKGFLFAIKASRFLTHMKKLKDPEEPLNRLFSRMRPLGRHLGPILYQLPPGWKVDLDRLEQFLPLLPRRARHAIEFRDPSWYRGDTLELLSRFRVALCLHDMRESATPRVRVALAPSSVEGPALSGSFVYVRFHGAAGSYSGSYTDRRLAEWADWLHGQRASGADVYAYFNNDVGGHAPRNAVTLRRFLEERL